RGPDRQVQGRVERLGRAGIHRAGVLTMAKGTPATAALQRAGVVFTLHEYAYDPDAERIGLQAAAALAVEPTRLLKTLLVKARDAVLCVLVPSDRALSLKKLAALAGTKG